MSAYGNDVVIDQILCEVLIVLKCVLLRLWSAGDDVMGDTIFGKKNFFLCALRFDETPG